MPIEFIQESHPTGSSGNSLFRLTMAYDGSGRRISKTRWVKNSNSQEWEKELVTHYTGIGTEVREKFSKNQTKVVVNMPQGLGRYGIDDAGSPDNGFGAGDIPNAKFEWYLKNHLGSTMLVYGTVSSTDPNTADIGETKAAYDYRAFGEMVTLSQPSDKVTENFTGKEHDDEISLDYFGARYLDPMLGMWISVDPKRQFSSPYLYAGNGYNPVNIIDPDGEAPYQIAVFMDVLRAESGEANLDVFRDFEATSRWGYKKFGEDFDIRIVRSPKEMLDFIKEGQYTAIVGHTWSGEKGKLFNRTHSPAVKLDLTALDNALIGSEFLVKVFGCKTGSWNMEFKKIEYGGNEGTLPIGDAFKEAARYLTESRDFNQRLENSKPVTQDE